MQALIAVNIFVGAVLAAPGRSVFSRSSEEPCALVSKALENSTIVNADLAYQCLQSVPLDTKGAVMQMEGIKTFTEFQSTLAYLKDPPEGYLYPVVDILEALDQVSAKLDRNDYAGEYEFQMDVHNVIASAYDGHFTYIADLITIFGFLRELPIFSVSEDGFALPEIYLGNDILHLQRSNDSTAISPVATINGQEVEAWLNDYAALTGFGSQDPDANYNTLFNQSIIRAFQGSRNYQGSSTNVTFHNGTARQLKHWATSNANFTGVTDGASFFQTFCTDDGKVAALDLQPDAPSSTATPATELPFKPAPTQTPIAAPAGYPVPVVRARDGTVAGYFSDQNKDLAVLSIPSFEPADPVEFSNVVRQFFASAKQAGKTKLMIDLRGNGGGTVSVAYDLFAQLFPKMYPYGATNFRTSPLMNDLGQVISKFYSNVTNATASQDLCGTTYTTPPFNYGELYDLEEDHFASWADFYGPHVHNKGNFTSLARFNLADEYSIYCTNTSNYGSLLNITPQVFQPEDVVLVQDGFCASTCAVFGEFMKTQANVPQIVFGGRKQLGPMQAIGGVKGASVYHYNALQGVIIEAFEQDATLAQRKDLDEKYGYDTLINSTALASSRAAGSGKNQLATVNMRNNIRFGDDVVTPLQFVYEAADCRLFYTAPMVSNAAPVWEAAYEAQWGNGKCVAGSKGHLSSKVGNFHPNTPPANARQNITILPSDLASYKGIKKAVRATGGATGSRVSTAAVVSGIAIAAFVILLL